MPQIPTLHLIPQTITSVGIADLLNWWDGAWPRSLEARGLVRVQVRTLQNGRSFHGSPTTCPLPGGAAQASAKHNLRLV